VGEQRSPLLTAAALDLAHLVLVLALRAAVLVVEVVVRREGCGGDVQGRDGERRARQSRTKRRTRDRECQPARSREEMGARKQLISRVDTSFYVETHKGNALEKINEALTVS